MGTHELCHLIAGILCGGQVVSICIDPNDGGATHVLGLMRPFPRVPRDPYAMPTYPQLCWSVSALVTLSAGYVGSSIVGFLFIVSSSDNAQLISVLRMLVCIICRGMLTEVVDIVASKAAALVLHFGLLVPILRADHWM